MRELERASVEQFVPGTILIGRSEQEPARDLAYVVRERASSGQLFLERHGRGGFTGWQGSFAEYGRKLAEVILARRPEGDDAPGLDAIVAHWNEQWELCTLASCGICPRCRTAGAPPP